MNYIMYHPEIMTNTFPNKIHAEKLETYFGRYFYTTKNLDVSIVSLPHKIER